MTSENTPQQARHIAALPSARSGSKKKAADQNKTSMFWCFGRTLLLLDLQLGLANHWWSSGSSFVNAPRIQEHAEATAKSWRWGHNCNNACSRCDPRSQRTRF